jgi:hypothetical protein
MKTTILVLLITLGFNVNAQQFFKSKSSTLNAISEKGYAYTQDKDNSNIYWYKRFDTYGESIVQLTFEGNNLRKSIIIHRDPTQTLTRIKDIYAKCSRNDSLSFDWPSDGVGVGIASNTAYYSGKARFECNNNYRTKDYLFTILILD